MTSKIKVSGTATNVHLHEIREPWHERSLSPPRFARLLPSLSYYLLSFNIEQILDTGDISYIAVEFRLKEPSNVLVDGDEVEIIGKITRGNKVTAQTIHNCRTHTHTKCSSGTAKYQVAMMIPLALAIFCIFFFLMWGLLLWIQTGNIEQLGESLVYGIFFAFISWLIGNLLAIFVIFILRIFDSLNQ